MIVTIKLQPLFSIHHSLRMTAKDIRNLRRVTYQLVEAEERSTHIRNLISKNVGFREEEEFRLKLAVQGVDNK